MNMSRALAILLSISLPGTSFAQTYSASRSGASPAGAAGSAGTIQTAPAGVALLPMSLLAPSLNPGFAPAVSPALLAMPSAVSAAPSAIELVSAIPALPAALAPVKAVPSAGEAMKPSAPALRSGVPAAPSKDAAAKTQDSWTAKISAWFDGGAAKKDDGPVDHGILKAFVVKHGQPMREITLAEAAAHRGAFRLLTAKNDPRGLSASHAAQFGGKARVQQEAIAIDWSPKAVETAAAEKAPETKGLKAKLLAPFREAKFLAKAFSSSLVKPLPSEILGGLATKSFPLVTSIGVYWATVGPAHPVALGGLIALSVFQEVFHGFYLKSWNNFQETLRRARGFNYQMFFNLAYMQGFGTLYRLLSWTANPASVTPPWSVHYWKDMAVMSVVGTFFGVLGYNALNELYAKGAIKRWQHSGIQQLRDLCFLLAAPFFASGSMTVFWAIFLFQQALDLAIAIWAARAKTREVVFVTSDAVAASPEFKEKYPEAGVKIEAALKQAGRAVVDNPLVRLMTWPARALWKAVRGGKK
ncbi:MAG: hypothetical protein M0D55_18125 [Elusimicrobiota bacterium]|nr:MAG: hypothetical protein M0D55_18125 [Elusimicrobiota bacterium]